MSEECIGFGEFEGKCDGVAGTRTGKFWCERCEALRVKHINNRFAELRAGFAKEGESDD